MTDALDLLRDVVSESPDGRGAALYVHDLDTGVDRGHTGAALSLPVRNGSVKASACPMVAALALSLLVGWPRRPLSAPGGRSDASRSGHPPRVDDRGDGLRAAP